MRKIIILSAFCFFAIKAKSQTFYQCFDSDTNAKLKISVKFVNDKAISVKYKGQTQAIPLVYVKQVYEKGSANTTTIYNEKFNGKITGKYLITHSGVWDYEKYRRQDGKVFNFTINQDLSVSGDSYRKTSCY